MIIWLLALLLVSAFAGLGYTNGAVRTLFGLLGLIFGALFAVPLGNLVKPLLPYVKVTNPAYLWLLPPVIGFLAISILFVAVGVFLHRLLNVKIKYHMPDAKWLAYERLSRRLGVCVGIVAGCGYTIMLSVVIYFLGYLTTQVAAADNDSFVLSSLNKARNDLHTSGFEKTASALDPMPDQYYTASDIIGIIHNNPDAQPRLSAYPPFLSLAERQEFQDLAADKDYQQMLKDRASIAAIIDNPKTQGILSNQEIMDALKAIDLKDLRNYLETGKSAKFDEIKILGRWQVDIRSVLAAAKVKYPMLTTNIYAMNQVRKFVTNTLPELALTAASDNKVYVKMPTPAAPAVDANGQPAAAAPIAIATAPRAPVTPNPQLSQQMAQRYGLTRSGQRQAPPAAPVARPVTIASAPRTNAAPKVSSQLMPVQLPKTFHLASEGSWKQEGDDYELLLKDDAGVEHKVKAKVENDKLVIELEFGIELVFAKLT